MPPVFTKMFAERLDRACAIKVVEAVDGMPVTPGVAYLAPGDYHLTVVGRPGAATTRLTQEPAENSCRPAADVLFRSVSAAYGDRGSRRQPCRKFTRDLGAPCEIEGLVPWENAGLTTMATALRMSANSSCCSRVICQRCATFSAVLPM